MKMWQYYLLLYVLSVLLSFICAFALDDVMSRDSEFFIPILAPPAVCIAVFIYRNAPPLKK